MKTIRELRHKMNHDLVDKSPAEIEKYLQDLTAQINIPHFRIFLQVDGCRWAIIVDYKNKVNVAYADITKNRIIIGERNNWTKTECKYTYKRVKPCKFDNKTFIELIASADIEIAKKDKVKAIKDEAVAETEALGFCYQYIFSMNISTLEMMRDKHIDIETMIKWAKAIKRRD